MKYMCQNVIFHILYNNKTDVNNESNFFSILSYQNGVYNFLSDRENLNKSNYRTTPKKEQGQKNMKSESHKFLVGY
jgi:hypothetical protein